MESVIPVTTCSHCGDTGAHGWDKLREFRRCTKCFNYTIVKCDDMQTTAPEDIVSEAHALGTYRSKNGIAHPADELRSDGSWLGEPRPAGYDRGDPSKIEEGDELCPASVMFKQVLDDIWVLHRSKGHDYGTDQDTFSNVRAAEEFGVPAWMGAVLRANDKLSRIKTFAHKGELAHESLEDSLIDAANYFMIALVLYRESQGQSVG